MLKWSWAEHVHIKCILVQVEHFLLPFIMFGCGISCTFAIELLLLQGQNTVHITLRYLV